MSFNIQTFNQMPGNLYNRRHVDLILFNVGHHFFLFFFNFFSYCFYYLRGSGDGGGDGSRGDDRSDDGWLVFGVVYLCNI